MQQNYVALERNISRGTVNDTIARKRKRKQNPSQNPSPIQPSHREDTGDAIHWSWYSTAQKQSTVVQRNSLQRETPKSWHRYRDIHPVSVRNIFYKLSMCLLREENMFFSFHCNLIHYHQPLFSETII